MVRHKAQWEFSGISDERVLAAMEAVQHKIFAPGNLNDEGFDNRSFPVDQEHTASRPMIVATMTEALRPSQEDRVLEVGAGSGYQTAILAQLVRKVYAIEIDPRLTEEARERLKRLGYRNIELRTGDGYDGWIEKAPFDSIIVTAAAEEVPHPLMDQLKDGGRMVIPLGTPFGSQELKLIEKHGRDVTTKTLMPVQFMSFRRHL